MVVFGSRDVIRVGKHRGGNGAFGRNWGGKEKKKTLRDQLSCIFYSVFKIKKMKSFLDLVGIFHLELISQMFDECF